MLRGTIIDQVNGKRRPYIRFFACGEDLSLEPLEQPLTGAVTARDTTFRIVGARWLAGSQSASGNQIRRLFFMIAKPRLENRKEQPYVAIRTSLPIPFWFIHANRYGMR